MAFEGPQIDGKDREYSLGSKFQIWLTNKTKQTKMHPKFLILLKGTPEG